MWPHLDQLEVHGGWGRGAVLINSLFGLGKISLFALALVFRKVFKDPESTVVLG